MSDSHRHVPLQNASTDAQRANQLLTVADVAGRIGCARVLSSTGA